ncbi:MAG: hypothetical protein KAJ57_12415, partial [Woeseiaceae bacterium]|nr:hypothetical protein [Woeseiaceae bacterium]
SGRSLLTYPIKKTLSMEILFQFFDEVDDFIIATARRLQRSLSPRPPERRQVLRTPDITAKPTLPVAR